MRPLIADASLFVAGLALGAALASRASAPSHVDVREGATLASYLPNAVMSLTYATSDGITTMQRSMPGASFEVLATFTDDRRAQRCSVSADMEGHLGGLTTLIARRGLSLEQREREFPVQLGVIDVRDALIGEPFGPVLVFANKDKAAVAIIADGRAAEVTLRAAELEWLKTACSRTRRFQGTGRACYGTLAVEAKTISWLTPFSQCKSIPYEFVERESHTGQMRIGLNRALPIVDIPFSR